MMLLLILTLWGFGLVVCVALARAAALGDRGVRPRRRALRALPGGLDARPSSRRVVRR